MYFGSDIWLSQPHCVSIWKCLLWREACLRGKNIQVSWQSTVKIFYCIQQTSLTWFFILPESQLRRLSICHTLRNEPVTYLLFTLFVRPPHDHDIAKFPITQFTIKIYLQSIILRQITLHGHSTANNMS